MTLTFLVAHTLMCAVSWASCFARLTRTTKATKSAVKYAYTAMAMVSYLQMLLPWIWPYCGTADLSPAWIFFPMPCVGTIMLAITNFEWFGGKPRLARGQDCLTCAVITHRPDHPIRWQTK